MNPLLLKYLQQYVEFKAKHGVEQELTIKIKDSELCEALSWKKLSPRHVSGLATQCRKLGIELVHNITYHRYEFSLHDLRLHHDYILIAETGKMPTT